MDELFCTLFMQKNAVTSLKSQTLPGFMWSLNTGLTVSYDRIFFPHALRDRNDLHVLGAEVSDDCVCTQVCNSFKDLNSTVAKGGLCLLD